MLRLTNSFNDILDSLPNSDLLKDLISDIVRENPYKTGLNNVLLKYKPGDEIENT